MKKVWRAIRDFFTRDYLFDVCLNDFHFITIEVWPIAFSLLQCKDGNSLLGYFSYYEFVDRSMKYVIQIAYREYVINDKVQK